MAARPALKPNAERYHVSEGQKATGRAGSASLEARAMVNKDATVSFEASTGTLDSTATPPGYLSKLQVKLFDGNAEVVLNREYTGLTGTGYRAYSYTDFVRGQAFQVQANIRGIDGNRTNVVTVTGTAKLRPDLGLTKLDVVGKIRVNTKLNVAAVIQELNGEIGATANCVLLIDGAEVDRADGIWVDAARSVGCVFTTSFTSAGSHTVGVKVEGQVPADYDTANNAKSVTVEAVSDVTAMQYQAYAADYEYAYSYQQDSYYRRSDGYLAVPDYSYGDNQKGWQQYAYVSASTPNAMTFPITKISASHTSGTELSLAVSLDNVSADRTWADGAGNSGGYVWRFDEASYSYVYLSTYDYSGSKWTYAQAQRYAGDVIYWGHNYYGLWYDSTSGSYEYYYSYNREGQSQYGTRIKFGSTYSIDLKIEDDGVTYQANPTIQLTPDSVSQSNPRQCYEYNWYSYGYRHCWENSYSRTGVFGSASSY